MILLDTHVVLWTVTDDRKLGPKARRRIARAGVRYVSSVTHVEVAIKRARDKLRAPGDLTDLLAASGFAPLPLEARHAAGLHRFPKLARHDPFDRMLVAQAQVDGLNLVTADQVLLDLDLPWILDATA